MIKLDEALDCLSLDGDDKNNSVNTIQVFKFL